MGYYSTIHPNFRIIPAQIEPLRKCLEKLYQEAQELSKKDLDTTDDSNPALVAHNLLEECFWIDDKGYPDFADYYGKWNKSEVLATILAPFIDKGSLEFGGEDEQQWGYTFEKGKVYEMRYIKKRGACLTA
jgi:hypothetical protein